MHHTVAAALWQADDDTYIHLLLLTLTLTLTLTSTLTLHRQADDDTYIHLPDAEAQLRSLPDAHKPHAYYGFVGYMTEFVSRQRSSTRLAVGSPGAGESSPSEAGATNRSYRSYRTHSYGGWADMLGRAQGHKRRRAICLTSPTNYTCRGPFPVACGPFFALGRSAVAALLASPGLPRELDRLVTLVSYLS